MEVDQPQVQLLPPDITIAKMSSRKRQWSPSRRAKMSSPKLPQALLSIRQHTTTEGNPGQLRSLPEGWKRQKSPQAGKGDVSFARLGTVSLQSVKQLMHFKACVSPYFLPCTASSRPRHGGQHVFCAPNGEERGTSGQDF